MSVPSMMGLETALRGLNAYQQGLDVTGNNIANANSPGYTRERVDLTPTTPLSINGNSSTTGAGAQLGTGVDVTLISRVRDSFLNIQYRAQNSAASNAAQTTTTLQQVQSSLAEPTDHGIQSLLGKFWGSWNDLANSPQSPAARQALISNATTLSQTFNGLDSQMATVQGQAGAQFAQLTGPSGPIAQDATALGTLNVQILNAKVQGQNPNQLLDQRDKLIDDLSQYGKVSVNEQANGMVTVNFGDAASPIVNGNTVTWPQSLTSPAATGGKLGSLMDAASPTGTIGTLRSSLDGVAAQLISSVNALHTSTPFFSGTGAGTIAVAATSATVQASSTGNAGANDLAVKIAALQSGPADQAYANFVGQVGSGVQASQTKETTSQAVLTNISNQRQSVSGVSLDEEMTNMLKFQRGYQAAARVMTTMDQMLEQLISHTGVVGL